MMSPDPDVLIVGAGPAGMSAALEAASFGLSVVVIDEAVTPGGQIYRNVEMSPAALKPLLGTDYARGVALAGQFRAAAIDYRPEATLWHLGPGLAASILRHGACEVIEPRFVLLATGALERPFPIPGWTLPGVMTAGAAQIALKAGGLVPDGRIVLAGGGPLLYLVATQLKKAGARLDAVLDTTPKANRPRALRKLPGALAAPADLLKGARMLAGARRGATRWMSEVEDIRITGDGCVGGLVYSRKGREQRLDADVVLLHQGVVPNVQILRSINVEMRWNDDQLCFLPVLDPWGETSVERLFVAGDRARISGASAAESTGRLAALRIAEKLLGKDLSRRAATLRAQARQQMAIRPFLDELYKPGPGFRIPRSPETVVCRCEGVTAGEILQLVELGCPGPNQLKFFSRCGMGPCQGRLCGLTITELMADAFGAHRDSVGYYRTRSPIRPIMLKELANLETDGGDRGDAKRSPADNRTPAGQASR